MKLAAVAARLDAYEKLVRLDKPVGILLFSWLFYTLMTRNEAQ